MQTVSPRCMPPQPQASPLAAGRGPLDARQAHFALRLSSNMRTVSVILSHSGNTMELLAARTKSNATALTLAAARGCVDTVRLLLAHGCCEADWDAAAAAAKGPALTFFRDVFAHEFRLFFERPSDPAAAAAACRSRFLDDMREYADGDSIDACLNYSSCAATSLFCSRYLQLRGAACDTEPAIRFLWHGCSDCIVDEVMRGGFKTSFANLTFNVYGAGVYFATDAKLSAYFVTTDVAAKQPRVKPASGKFRMVLAAVILGRVGTRVPLNGGSESERRQMKGDLKHPANRNPPLGCDCATGPSLKEVVVYDNAMALPFACVSFNLKSGLHLPDPYASNAADTTFLRDLHQVPTHTMPQLLSRGGLAASVDFSPLLVVQHPPLLCGWRPGADVDDNEALVERVAELELRVAQLEREIVQLRALQLPT